MRPPLNHMMLNEDPLADEFDAILNYRVMHAGLVLSGGPSEDEVFAGAGITAGVTPGVLDRATGTTAGVYSTDYGIIPGNGSTHTDKGGFAVFNVTSAAAFTGHNAFTTNGTGTGTAGDPYTISNCLFYSPSTAAAAFTWNHSAATYHIKFVNCAFLTPQTNMNMFEITNSGSGTLTLEGCQLGGINNSTSTYAFVKVTAGAVSASRCFITRCTGYAFWKAGASATITVADSKFDTTGGSWPGSFGSAYLFYNTVAGGSISVSRTSFDHKSASSGFLIARDTALTIDRVFWNQSNDATCQVFIPTTSALLEAWTSGLTLTDSRIYAGNANVPIIGASTTSDNQDVANWTVTNCDFIRSNNRPSSGNAFMVTLGNSSTGTGLTQSITFSWCRFQSWTGAPGVSGNEVFYISRGRNVTLEYCWIHGCSEDGYEFHQPIENCIVRYCGGTDVGGNMVDFYGAFGAAQADAAWGASDGNVGGHQAHHLWGNCGGDALIVDCVHGVAVSNIDVDNVAGGFVANPPAANVRLHWRSSSGTPSLNGVTVATSLSDPSISYDDKPSELTYETGSDTYATGATAIAASTLTWYEWNGSGWDARGCQHGIVDNMA